MKRGGFKFGNLTSESIGAVITHWPGIPIPERKILVNNSPIGIDRAIIYDRNSYENRKFSLTIAVKNGNADRLITTLSTGRYVDAVFYFDEKYTYQVILTDSIEVKRPSIRMDYREYTLTFSSAPYKLLNDVADVPFSSTTALANPTLYNALPYIKLVGNGNMSLTLNGVAYTFTGVQGSIELDSALQNVWRTDGVTPINENAKMKRSSFPVLNPGTNVISVSNGTGLIKPRWRSL